MFEPICMNMLKNFETEEKIKSVRCSPVDKKLVKRKINDEGIPV